CARVGSSWDYYAMDYW
nr:immunoglobulin heavy chain junction region [Mus musculus]